MSKQQANHDERKGASVVILIRFMNTELSVAA